MKVIVKGAYGTRNFGDDLLMLTMFNMISQVECEVDFQCPEHSYIKKLNPNIKLNSNNTNKDYDICVFGGGTQFFNFNSNKAQKLNFVNKLVGNLVSPKRLLNTIARKLNNDIKSKANSYIGIGLGPFEDERAKKAVLTNIAKAEFISLRDKKSINYLKTYVNEMNYGADLCFSPQFESYLLSVKDNRTQAEPKVGIILRDWENTEHGKVPEAVIRDVLKELEKKNKDYIFIFFSSVHDKGWIQFCNKYDYRYIVWNPDQQTVGDFLNELASCDIIVSSRFHGLVVSSLLSIPFVSIEIEPKLSLFSEKFENFETVKYPFKAENIIKGIATAEWIDDDDLVVMNEKERAKIMADNFNKYLRSKVNE
ncbi:TPA: hypothetical protein I7185_13775 [Vibrio vulnificus]|nr:hypothetical protein [Vibrio vulnificus]